MELKDKAISIKGKQYVLVSDRILYFNETYPKGSIRTELLSKPEDERVVVKATVYRDFSIDNYTTGHSQAVVGDGYINKTSALENAETSAVGRALAMMGIGVIDSIASMDEINKTTHQVKEDHRKDQITTLCRNLGFKGTKLEEFQAYILNQTKLTLTENNFDAIIKELTEINNLK